MKKFKTFLNSVKIRNGSSKETPASKETCKGKNEGKKTAGAARGEIGFADGSLALPEGEEIKVCTMTDMDVYITIETAQGILRQQGDLSERQVHEVREKVLCLVESGNESSIYTYSGLSLLCDCIIHDRMEVLEMLKDLGVNFNSSSHATISRNLPLNMACSFGKLEYVSFFLEHGAHPTSKCSLTVNPDGKRKDGESREFDAYEFALDSDNVNVLQILLKYPASMSLVSSYILHSACRFGAINCVKLILCEFPEQIKAADSGGVTALWYAFWKNPTIAVLLAETCPDIVKEITPEKSYTMLLKVCSAPSNVLGSYEREEAIRFLLKYGDSSMLSRSDEDGNTPLHHLCLLCGRSSYHLEGPMQNQEDYDRNLLTSIRLLVEAGADINAKNSLGYPPLLELITNKPKRKMYESCFTFHFLKITYSCVSRAMVLLLDLGASLYVDQYTHPLTKLGSLADRLSTISLHSAHPYMKTMVTAILEKGCDPHIQSCMGWPALLLFMEAYLARECKYSCLNLSTDFLKILDVFIEHNVTFCEFTLRTNLHTRKSNVCKEMIYIMMQDIKNQSEVRVPVIQSFDKIIDVLQRQNKRMNMSHPELKGRNISYQGNMEFYSFCIHIYRKGRSSAKTELLNLLAKLCDVVEPVMYTDFKCCILREAQNVPSQIQCELENALLKRFI